MGDGNLILSYDYDAARIHRRGRPLDKVSAALVSHAVRYSSDDVYGSGRASHVRCGKGHVHG
jgi:hypothetical protein